MSGPVAFEVSKVFNMSSTSVPFHPPNSDRR
jgi:hypothetical protein